MEIKSPFGDVVPLATIVPDFTPLEDPFSGADVLFLPVRSMGSETITASSTSSSSSSSYV
jgi:hypothetical protein